MLATELIHHFASVVLESGARKGLTANMQLRRLGPNDRWSGRDFVRFMREIGVAMDDIFYGLTRYPCPA